MSIIKTVLYRIGYILISIVRAMRRAICCRRKKEPEYLLPLTVEDIELRLTDDIEYNAKYQWDAWPDTNTSSPVNNGNIRAESCNNPQNSQLDGSSQEDFFKDMVPQIRKPKKIYIKNDENNAGQEQSTSNRLAMDPKAIFLESDLGIIDDNPSNWEDEENLDDMCDPDSLIREKKHAEKEKRRAEHQRRKLEKENRRSSKPESLSSMMLTISDSKDKHKNT